MTYIYVTSVSLYVERLVLPLTVSGTKVTVPAVVYVDEKIDGSFPVEIRLSGTFASFRRKVMRWIWCLAVFGIVLSSGCSDQEAGSDPSPVPEEQMASEPL